MEYPNQSPRMEHNHTPGDLPTCSPCEQNTSQGWGLSTHPLAMVYAPYQSFQNLYDIETALSHGTLFSELDLPILTANGPGGQSCGCVQNRRN